MTKRARRRAGGDFPLATVAFYGPDTTRATKLVVSIFNRSIEEDPQTAHTWMTDLGDVRTDATIQADVGAFITSRKVKRTAISDRLLGCPHQEGLDYPMGRLCPQCPAWATIDRFTHEPLPVVAPSMSVDEVLALLSGDPRDGEELEEALASADAHRAALVEPLLAAIDRALDDPAEASPEDASLFAYGMYLLAKWRETRAYSSVIRWLSLPEEGPSDIGGDMETQDGGRILAAICDGNVDPIMALVLNRGADPWGRGAGITALAMLAAWGEMPRSQIVERLLWLAQEGLEREASPVWGGLAVDCADIEAVEVFPALRRAYDDQLIDPEVIEPTELDEVEQRPRGETIRQIRESRPPISDVLEATAWWNREWHDDDEPPYGDEPEKDGDAEAMAEPYRAPAKVGRNAPCPCGSGKKYKKCCGA